jgi:DNA-binding transcriptional LysR family regulator
MNSLEGILSILRTTSLASVLAAGTVDASSGLSAVRLIKPTPKRWVALLWRKDGHRNPAAIRMAEMIQQAYLDRSNASKGDA